MEARHFVVVHNKLKHFFKNEPSTDNTPEVISYDIPIPTETSNDRSCLFMGIG